MSGTWFGIDGLSYHIEESSLKTHALARRFGFMYGWDHDRVYDSHLK